jgi:hypothetical protein
MKSQSEFKRITKEEYPEWVNQLQVSKKSPEEYLTSFANWCVKYAIKNGVGDTKNLGEKLTVHISDTRGRKTISNNNQGKAVGLCYAVGYSPNGSVRRIEIDREEGDTLKALEIVAHEVSHAILSEGVGHKGDFVKAVFGVFKLGSIPTATSVTMEFAEIVESWVKKAGSYPYIKFIDGRKKQTTRMVKLYCPDVECAGATNKSVQQGQGTIFRLSSAIVDKIQDRGDSIWCPVCSGIAYIDSPVLRDIYV